jgi:Zn-dependent alcohol dehydrogenase
MKSRAAVLHAQPGKWEVVEVDIDLPLALLPITGGHEGAGLVEEVGPRPPLNQEAPTLRGE